MYKFIVNSGAGFSPAKRRQLEALASPWGTIQETHSIAPGIEEIKTESHGGYVLGEQAQSDMPKHLTLNSKYYEEDCEGALVELAFPEFFPDSIKYALASIGIYSSISVPHYVPQEHLDWLDSVSSPLFKKKGHESKTPNRDMTDAEKHVVKYLAKCVLNNRNPIKMPDSTYPSLQDWVTCLESAMTVDGEWPLGKGKWKEHFYSEDIY